MTMTRQILVKYLESQFGLNAGEIDDGTQLFSSGLLDSFSVADLLMFLEEQDSFTIEPTEITLDNLDSIEKIIAFVKRKVDLTCR